MEVAEPKQRADIANVRDVKKDNEKTAMLEREEDSTNYRTAVQ